MLEAPARQRRQRGEELLARGGEVVLDADRDVGVDAALDQAVLFEPAQRGGEHAAGDAVDLAQELVEAVGAVGELGEDRDAPLRLQDADGGLHPGDVVGGHARICHNARGCVSRLWHDPRHAGPRASRPRRPRLLQGHVQRRPGRGCDRARARARRADAARPVPGRRRRRGHAGRAAAAARRRADRAGGQRAARRAGPHRLRPDRGRRDGDRRDGDGQRPRARRRRRARRLERQHLRHRPADRRRGAGRAPRSSSSPSAARPRPTAAQGALEAIEAAGGIGKAKIVVLCDVRTVFEDAPKVFGPQKGADAAHGQAARSAAGRTRADASRATRAACR